MPKDRYWFRHDSSAHDDPKILELIAAHGWEGYGVFWAIVEALRECDGYKIPSRSIPGLCFRMRIEQSIIDSMIEIGLLVESDEMIYSESLLERMEEWDIKRQRCRAAASLGGKAKAERTRSESVANAKANAKQTPTDCSADALPRREEKRREEKRRINTVTRACALDTDFDSFWKMYPKKIGKKAALRAFQNARKSGLPEIHVVVSAIEKHRKSDQWRRDGGKFIPNPATWLNQGRWDDEIKTEDPALAGIIEWYNSEEEDGQNTDRGLFGTDGEKLSRAVPVGHGNLNGLGKVDGGS
jgi:hypothetical protein